MVERQTYTAMPAFTGRNVPVTEIAKAMHKHCKICFIGWLNQDHSITSNTKMPVTHGNRQLWTVLSKKAFTPLGH